ncbi:LapB repeat-containing protein, partial [Listeria booriae]|uniref:LapB repeat-containing protein n=1 Tax=Listeria booriae TaxID=1552123 RepID=UPI00162A28BB
LVLNVTDEGTPEINVDASKLTYELGGEPLSETSTPEEFTAYIGLMMTDNASSEETLRANLTVDGFDEINFTTAGEYPITLSTSDESGNEANLDVNFTIEDTVVPVLSVDNQRISQSFGEDYAFTSESLAKASYAIDEAGLEALNTAIQSNDLTNAGEYSVEVTAKDSSGNVAIPVTVVVNVQDTEAPVLEADLSHSLVQYTTLPTADEIKESIHATVTDKVDKELSVADIQVTDLDSIDMEVAGTSTIKLSVVDGSGNESERTVDIEVQADTDKDGIPDSDEKDEGTDPLNPDNDPDGDDVPDGDDKDGNDKPDGGENIPLIPENNPNTQGDQANTSGANKEPSTKTTQIELPATGDDTSTTTTLFGGIMALLGTIWIKRRSKKEKTVTTKK